MTDSKTDVKEEDEVFEVVLNKYISFNSDQCRDSPLKPLSTGGIVLLRDGKPEEPEVNFNFKTKVPLIWVNNRQLESV